MHSSTRFGMRFGAWVTNERNGGVLLLCAAMLALLWANSPWRGSYEAISAFTIGPEALHLHLSLAAWAADGLLAVFFFVVGAELIQEFTTGSLRNPREAAVPMLAAVGGMVMPAAIFMALVLALGRADALHGWAIPAATDIAFALAVLAIFGRGLPTALRTFLLTLAVVDDLLAIVVIAVAYTATIDLWLLGAALAAVAAFAVVARLRRMRWWLLVPLALLAWGCMHASGVHATIAGVLLGLVLPARQLRGEAASRAHVAATRCAPLSTGVALPLFAFFAAGVSLHGSSGESAPLSDPVMIGVILGLVIGKPLGVLATVAAVTRWTPLTLPTGLRLRHLLPVGALAGIGFTVSLLIAGLAFTDSAMEAAGRLGVLLGTAISAVIAAWLLRRQARAGVAAA